MKKLILVLTVTLAMAAPAAFAADSGGHGEHASHGAGGPVHEEVIDGVKATFTVQTMKDAMKGMGMEMPKGVKETHHLSVSFLDAKTGKALTEGEVTVKVQNPDKTAQTQNLTGMQGHFGGDFTLAKKGKYGIMCKFKLMDGKTRSAKFWYTAK